MTKKKSEDSYNKHSLRDMIANSRRINNNIVGKPHREPSAPSGEEEEEEIIPANMKVAELKAALDEAGIAYKPSDKKDDLVQLYSDYLADNSEEEEEEEGAGEGGEGDGGEGEGAGGGAGEE